MPNPSRHIPRIASRLDNSKAIRRFTEQRVAGRIARPTASRAANSLEGDPMLKQISTAALCLATLSSCKSEVDLTLFTSDIAAVARDGTALDASAIVSLEASTEEKCSEVKDAVATALAVGFSKVEFVACRKSDFDTWADFRVAVPVAQPDKTTESALTIVAGDLGGTIGTTLRQNPDRIDSIVKALPRDMSSLVTGRLDAKIRLTLQNDLPGPVTITAQGVFLNGEPYQLPKEITLERRGEATITLSDVGNAAIHTGGSLLFFMKTP